MRRGLGFHARRSPGVFNPASLFLGGTVQGAWYDPSDSTTLFTDRAGTTPCGTPGGGSVVPVGLMLDKSQNGVGTNGAKRVNLLTYSEQFDNAAWTKSNVTATANTSDTTAPDGTNTADKILESGVSYHDLLYSFSQTSGVVYRFSVYVKGGLGRDACYIYAQNTAGGGSAVAKFNLNTGAYLGSGGGALVPFTTYGSESVGNGWFRIFGTYTAPSTAAHSLTISLSDNTGPNINTYTGDPTKGMYVWGADLRLASEASTLPTYQRITDTWYATEAGNHAIAANDTTARPELSARVNLLTYSEDFSNAVWGTGAVGGASISKGTTTGVRPDGTTGTVHTLTFSAVGAGQLAIAFQAAAQAFLNVQLTSSLYVRVASGTATIYLNLEDSGTPPSGTNFVAGSAQTVTTSWQRISLTGTRATAPNAVSVVIGFDTRAAAGQTNAAPVTIEVWGADLRPTNIGTTIPAYQRIADANTYDAVGFPRYFAFNGTSSAMSTPANVNLSGTDKATVFAGVRKNADGSVIAEFSANAGTNNGAFVLATGGWAAENGTYVRQSRGTATAFAQPAANSYPSPRTDVLTGTSDIAGDSVVLRVNGTQVATSATDQGTGNYGTYPLFIGSRNNASLFLNGNIYSLIVVGSAVSAGQISATETWVAGKTGITI